MTKFCTECGFENLDYANFCANCGNPFEEDIELIDQNKSLSNNQSLIPVPKKYNGYNIIGETQCINCRQNTFVHLNKKSLLSEKLAYFCSNCGLMLEKQGNGFKIMDIQDKNNRMWELYKNTILSIEEWERIANGGLSNKDQAERNNQLAIERQQELELQRKKDIEIVTGILSRGEFSLRTVSSPVILKKNEEAYLSLPNITLSEPRAVRVSKSAGTGASFRVTKGIAVHSGGGQSKSVSHEEIMAIDNGTFVITNKRVIFVGSKKTVNIDLTKILAMNIYKDGISIQRENKQKVEYFTKTNRNSMTFTLDGREQTLDLEGYLVRAIILGQIAKLE